MSQKQWLRDEPCLQAAKYAATAVKKHLSSKSHGAASRAPPAADLVSRSIREKFSLDIRNRCYMVAFNVKHALATSLFTDMLLMTHELGAFQTVLHTTSAGSVSSGNASWSSKRTAAEMRSCIAKAIAFKRMSRWESSPLYSLMADEVSSHNISLYMPGLRGVDLHQPEGEAMSDTYGTAFVDHLGLQTLTRGNAQTVFLASKHTLEMYGLPLERCAFSVSDGASVFSGQYNGVHQKINDAQAELTAAEGLCTGIHCVRCPLTNVVRY
jgi:hypothetical protein